MPTEDASHPVPQPAPGMEACTPSAAKSGAEPEFESGAEPSALAGASSWSDFTPERCKAGVAAWLGWLFDGLDMHLYTVVATPFVATLLLFTPEQMLTKESRAEVGFYSSWIQAAFLLGWALGGAFFGRVGDLLGRTRTLSLTILTYAIFTGMAFFAQTWWQLLIYRFLAALGIGGEWAVGASLVAETWPRAWRPWLAAILQSAVNVGILLASLTCYVLADWPHRYVFLVGVVPALLVVWIRGAVPEPTTWHHARQQAGMRHPRLLDLFRGAVLPVTLTTVSICALGLTGHWALMFWFAQHLRGLPQWESQPQTLVNAVVSQGFALMMVFSILGNFVAAALARAWGYRFTLVTMFLAYFLAMFFAYNVERDYQILLWVFYPLMGFCSGLFALFTMYLPPLFPTLLRTTGAGFCYNIGRIAAAAGTVFFGWISPVGDYRFALFLASFLFLPAALVGFFLREPPASDLSPDSDSLIPSS